MNFFTIPLSRSVKQLLMMLADGVMLALALWLSLALLGVDYRTLDQSAYLYLGLANIASVLVFFRIGLYRAILLYMGLQSAFVVLQGVTISTCLLVVVSYFFLGAGAYLLFARAVSAGAALVGAVAITFAGPTLSLLDVSNNLATLAWIPVALWCAAEGAWSRGGIVLALAFLVLSSVYVSAGELVVRPASRPVEPAHGSRVAALAERLRSGVCTTTP